MKHSKNFRPMAAFAVVLYFLAISKAQGEAIGFIPFDFPNALLDEVLEGPASPHQLHREPGPTVGHSVIVDGDDPRVIETAAGTRLADKERQGVFGDPLGQEGADRGPRQ